MYCFCHKTIALLEVVKWDKRYLNMQKYDRDTGNHHYNSDAWNLQPISTSLHSACLRQQCPADEDRGGELHSKRSLLRDNAKHTSHADWHPFLPPSSFYGWWRRGAVPGPAQLITPGHWTLHGAAVMKTEIAKSSPRRDGQRIFHKISFCRQNDWNFNIYDCSQVLSQCLLRILRNAKNRWHLEGDWSSCLRCAGLVPRYQI